METQIVATTSVASFQGNMARLSRAHMARVSSHCHLDLSLDGNQWCVLFGGDLQAGIAGFGATPSDAIDDFERQFKTANDRPPVPTKKFDWSCWIDGREEWLTGHGSTEAEAIRDLLTQIEEA